LYVILNHDHNWSAQWNIQINQLGDFIHNTIGSVHTLGHFNHGSLDGNGQIILPTLVTNLIQAHHLNAKWNIEKYRPYPFTGNMSFDIVSYQGKIIKNAAVSVSGDRHQQRASLSFMLAGHHTVSANLQGLYDATQNKWSGLLTALHIEQSALDRWQLTHPTTIAIDTQGVNVSPLELSDHNYHFFIDGNYAFNQSWQINSHAHLFLQPIALQNPLFKGIDVAYEATLQGHADAINQLSILSDANIHLHHLNQTIKLHSNLTYSHEKISFQNSMTQDQHTLGTANATLALQNFSQLADYSALPATFDIHMHIPSTIYTAMIQAFLPTVDAKSDFILESSFNGTLLNQNLSLQAQQSGDLYIQSLNKTFQNTRLRISTNPKDNHLNLTMITHLDNKPITLTGTISPFDHDFSSTWHLQSAQLRVMNQPDQQVDVIPNLTASCTNFQCSVSGIIKIPFAQYQMQPVFSSNTLPEDDITYIYNNQANQGASVAFANLTIEIGNDVHIAGYGLHGMISGKLSVNKKINQPLLLSGSIHLNKAYFLWGNNRLNLKIAQLSYLQSPFDNPTLHIVGEKNIQIYALPNSQQQSGTVMVGLAVSGSFKHPNVNLYSSSSALSQADILSYVLFNQPASTTTLLHSASLITTLKSASNLGATPLTSLQNKLGFTEFGIQTQSALDSSGNVSSSQNNEFVVGKKLGKKIYLRYAMGLSNSSSALIILIYQINHRWSLQSSESLQGAGSQQSSQSSGSAIDLMYQFSK
jgi:autotransporter translocation and assembly factor TamB